MPQPCNLDGISMNIQEENSAHYFRVQNEHEQTLVTNFPDICAIIIGFSFTVWTKMRPLMAH